MAYVPSKSGTLLIPSGVKNGQDVNHLHAIVTDICVNSKHLLLSVTTLYPDRAHDPACLIKAGEHRFIQHDSYVLYRSSRVEEAARLTRFVDAWMYKEHDAIKDDLLTRMLDGVLVSRFTPKYIKTYIQSL